MVYPGFSLTGKPLGQERGEGERADRRHAQGREIDGQGGLAQRPPVHRHLYAEGLRPGDGPTGEGMPRKVTGGLGAHWA